MSSGKSQVTIHNLNHNSVQLERSKSREASGDEGSCVAQASHERPVPSSVSNCWHVKGQQFYIFSWSPVSCRGVACGKSGDRESIGRRHNTISLCGDSAPLNACQGQVTVSSQPG